MVWLSSASSGANLCSLGGVDFLRRRNLTPPSWAVASLTSDPQGERPPFDFRLLTAAKNVKTFLFTLENPLTKRGDLDPKREPQDRPTLPTLIPRRWPYFVADMWKGGQGYFLSRMRTPRVNDVTSRVPIPPVTGTFLVLFGFVLALGFLLDKLTQRTDSKPRSSNPANSQNAQGSITIQAPTGVSLFLERDLQRKESVEWVNMVLGKLWKVYRIGLESWLVSLLQPIIDNLQKPEYVKRVEIKQFFLGDEPLTVRSVERRTSRRVNDLQYHIGLRYTGGARTLLLLKLKFGFIPITIPVGVRGLDVDGELWVKLRLVPFEPYVGSATWAFVSLPKIKLDLAPFLFFNLMAVPFISVFLTKLLTQDLPQLFVRPNKNVIDFLQGKAVGSVPKDLKGTSSEGNKDFSGELSVTLVDARKLTYVPYGKTDPYVVLILGDQVIRSKKNSQTSVIGPPGGPIWNQDFQILVVDPKNERLSVEVRDSFGLTTFTVGTGEVDLSMLQDTVPADIVVTLRGGLGLFPKRFSGEVSLRLTYKAYIEDEEDNVESRTHSKLDQGVFPDSDENCDDLPFAGKVATKTVVSVKGKDPVMVMFSSIISEFNDNQEISAMVEGQQANSVNSPREEDKKNNDLTGSSAKSLDGEGNGSVQIDQIEESNDRMTLVWLGVITGAAILVSFSLDFANVLNP